MTLPRETIRVKLILLALRLFLRHFAPWRQAKHRRNMSVLDVGCGTGSPAAAVTRRFEHRLVGLDIFSPVLKNAKRSRAYSDLVLADASRLPFADDSFHIVVCTEVLEHVPRDQGLRLLQELERVSGWLVMVSCPVGKWEQGARAGNPYQRHQYVWDLGEIRHMRFNKVRGVGLRGFSGDRWTALVNSPLRPFLRLLGLLATVVTYRWPRLASNVFAWKEVPGARLAPGKTPAPVHPAKALPRSPQGRQRLRVAPDHTRLP
ncbi:MAG: class I SAM-dependent methyltransferase [Chloroflexota bacterium]